MLKQYFLVLLMLVEMTAIGQKHKCMTDYENDLLDKSNPKAALESKMQMEAATLEYIQERKRKSFLKAAESFIIPVVVHVLHDGDKENLPDSVVYNLMKHTNEYFNKKNPELPNIVPSFQSIIADAGIEFRLATIDPRGKCTNGIVHHYLHSTHVGNNGSKVDPWPREKYLNIWICKAINNDESAFGTLAYSMYPKSVNVFVNNEIIDGIISKVVVDSRLPNYNNYRHVLAHEIGHYLNLSHVWGDSNSPGLSCGDDGVDDTPLTMGNQGGCVLNRSECTPNVIENEQNIMNYSDCAAMFTEGQKLRMHAALALNISNRNNLYTPANLIATGTDQIYTPNCAPIAEFGADKRVVCINEKVVFTDFSYNAKQYDMEWTFPADASVASANTPQVTVTFSKPGYKEVILKVTNSAGSSTITKSNVYITEQTNFVQAPYFENFESANWVASNWGIINYDNNNTSFTHQSAIGRNSFQSMKLNHYRSKYSGDRDELVSPMVNMSTLYPTDSKLSFDYTYATFAGNVPKDDTTAYLQVLASLNCGATWTKIYTLKGMYLFYGGDVSEDYYPKSDYYWGKVKIDLSKTAFHLKDNVMFKFVVSGVKSANNFYIDNINFGEATEKFTSGVSNFTSNPIKLSVSEHRLSLYPNANHPNFNLTISNQLGQIVLEKKMENMEEKSEIDMTQFSKGVYFVTSSSNAFVHTDKIEIQ